ncbi:metallophosphoesterase [Roseiconus lacunae]|uniref:Metallophosphoesterase n=1 Tax=Roseiconus lacunae TaxID=2605694 RepID=A0ABT7PMB3_9BACT|nr:metallophosphoesterase [Roseiconus lacunae]MCD0460827.1 metallophosphoesterase [Roseiconus lacunae]MDM4017419.1 metallophosphoesterase [Roseiconus lacunae]WRQ48671.1 metallophosphoesterase [Stieleria sp. HD01]
MNGFWNVLLFLLILIGHGGLHVAIYNRVNAFGWQRKTIKRWVKAFFINTFALPTLILLTQHEALNAIIRGEPAWGQLSAWTLTYFGVCLATWGVFGIPWLLWRPIFGLEWADAKRQSRMIDVAKTTNRSLLLTPKAQFESRLPFNQLLELSIDEIELPVAGLPEKLDGYRIAHLSDIHLTGEIHADYARYVVAQATRFRPDLFALTGDIIDSQPCIDWLFDIFSPAQARDGCFFILGNHDTRVVDSWETRQAMDRAGWIDLGSQAAERELAGVNSLVVGNESPWFERPIVPESDAEFRLLLSHSPDQIWWARRHGFQLMLAGHTHGGQGRLPVAGPILSPSFHGSRFASGSFYKAPTTLQVSRGLGGVHLLRLNCRPELSIVTLRSQSS